MSWRENLFWGGVIGWVAFWIGMMGGCLLGHMLQ